MFRLWWLRPAPFHRLGVCSQKRGTSYFPPACPCVRAVASGGQEASAAPRPTLGASLFSLAGRFHVSPHPHLPLQHVGVNGQNVHPGPRTAFLFTRRCQTDALPRTLVRTDLPPGLGRRVPWKPGVGCARLGDTGRCSRCDRRANRGGSQWPAGTRCPRWGHTASQKPQRAVNGRQGL